VSGGQVVCCPLGEFVSVGNDGVNLSYSDLERIGSYMDFRRSSVPNRVSGC
jgi:hypothetical protein